MKASELRINNTVKHVNETLIVNSVTDSWINGIIEHGDVLDFVDIDDIEGILLTEEWLDKFGFEKHRPGKHLGWYEKFYMASLHEEGCLFLYNIHSGALILTVERCDDDKTDLIIGEFQGFIGYKVQYVHRMQNLWFEITNKELTIK